MLTGEIIGRRIKEARENNSISQQQMVESLKEFNIQMSRETFSKIENGNRTISAIELKAICSILNVDPEILLDDEEEDNLVTLFRKKNASDETLKSVETIQEMILSFMNQKKILNKEVEKQSAIPLWRV